MIKVSQYSRVKIAAGAAMLLFAPANTASAGDLSAVSLAKSSAILGGAPSRLAMIAAQQNGGAPAPVVTPLPAVRVEARVSTGAPDLFGTKAIRVSATRLDGKWKRVSRTAFGAGPAIRIAHAGRAEQLRQVNSWVNHAITFSEDRRTYGKADHWASAQETLRRGRGDCEDFAIAKMQILRAAGVPLRDLNLMIVRDLVRRQDHAVLAVRTEAGFAILDSNTDRVLRAEDVADYRPIITFSSEGAWIHGYAERPQLMLASNNAAMAGSN